MKKYVSPEKRSKKAQREYHAKQRRTWGELNPVTRSVPSKKTYNRKKEKARIGKEFRNGFDAGLFLKSFFEAIICAERKNDWIAVLSLPQSHYDFKIFRILI